MYIMFIFGTICFTDKMKNKDSFDNTMVSDSDADFDSSTDFSSTYSDDSDRDLHKHHCKSSKKKCRKSKSNRQYKKDLIERYMSNGNHFASALF